MTRFLELTRENKVAAFLTAAGKTPLKEGDSYDLSYENNLMEEASELKEAVFAYYNNPNETTRADVVKEWADVQVVLSNIAVWLNIPADAAFNRVHDNNMTKVVGGKILRREDGKILKPEGYVKPDMRGL